MAFSEKEFTQLINQHQGIIHKICLMYEPDRDAREDLFQEIVLQLWKSFSSFRGEAKITTWMYRIALNTAISGWRKQKKRIATAELEDKHINLSDNSDENPEESFAKLQAAIQQLSEVDRGMIMMALDEMPYEEIALVIGITQNNVRVRMNRIREKLKKMMV
jgi:RNA polymerase sigma-70 factor (ECF subfamily)